MLKKQKHMTIPIDTEKQFYKIQHPFMIFKIAGMLETLYTTKNTENKIKKTILVET